MTPDPNPSLDALRQFVRDRLVRLYEGAAQVQQVVIARDMIATGAIA